MIRLWSSLLLCATAFGADPEQAVRARLRLAVERKEIAGAVLTVMHRDSLVFEEAVGWADIENRRPMTVRHYFHLASATKPISATAIVMLVNEGKLSLDEPAAKWFPQLAEPGPSPAIRQLLSHTSGMFGLGEGGEEGGGMYNPRRTLAQAAEGVLRQPLLYKPGEKAVYGGASFLIAGRIAELVSGREFDGLVRDKVFDPLGMTLSFYRLRPARKDVEYPVTYRRGAEGLLRAPHQPQSPESGGLVLVGGGLTSRAADLIPFLQLHRRMGTFASEIRLSPKLAAEMRRDQTGGKWRSPVPGDTSSGYGLGWMLEEIGADGVAYVFGHAGAFGSILWCDARAKLDVVFLTQMPIAQVFPVWQDVLRKIRAGWQ